MTRPSDSFYGPFLKAERAKHHIDQLEAIFGDYIRNNVDRLGAKNQDAALESADVRTFPKHTSTILGDAIHNLHAALDHAYHAVCDANGATFSEYRRFPFGKHRQSLAGSINGHKLKGLTPSDKIISVILDEIEPYPGGKFALYDLHELDITDKHLVLIPTSTRLAVDQRLDIVDASGTKTLFSIQGLSLVKEKPEQGGEFFGPLPSGARAIFQGEPKDAFSIVFRKGQPFEGENILGKMRSLRFAVMKTLALLKAAV